MATTAQSFAGLEVYPGNDAMDLHSDNGYPLHDVDVEFDLDPTTDIQTQEDDVLSLQDAATDGDVDLQSGTRDPDDFMVDKEDMIEEDDIDYSDLQFDTVGQSTTINVLDESKDIDNIIDDTSAVPPAVAEQDATVDEDLIDYSDEEQEADEDNSIVPQSSHANVELTGGIQQQESPNESLLQAEHISETMNELEGEDEITFDEHETADQVQHDQAAEQTSTEVDGTTWNEPKYEANIQSLPTNASPEITEQSFDHGLEMHQGDKLSEQQPDVTFEGAQQSAERDAQEDAELHQDIDLTSSLHLPPVTINYDGAEFWLFKSHNDDGEWLLDDESVATQPIALLFAACRATLSEDISSGTELGFRFDNFHALELYQDSTACAVASLKELLDLYSALHAQDGNNDPESFYITLQFRPRVISLIGDIKKAVEDQIGFSGLNNAIAAGSTNFISSYIDHTVGQLDEQWDNGEQEEKGNEYTEVHEQGYDQGDDDNSDDSEPSHEALEAVVDEAVSHQSGASSEADGSDGSDPQEDGSPQSQHIVPVSAEGSDVEDQDEAPLEDDLLEYSDDESPSNAGPASNNSAQEPSSVSSTVQGDTASISGLGTETYADMGEPIEGDTQAEDDSKSSDHDEQGLDNLENESFVELAEDKDENATGEEDLVFDESYNEFVQDDAQDFLPDTTSAAGLHQDDGNYSYEEADTILNAEDHHGFNEVLEIDATLEHESAQSAVDDTTATADDFLDLTGVDDDVDNDVISSILPTEGIEFDIEYDDQEGAAVAAPLAASSVASPAITSVVGLDEHSSPQGQKRPIDEVDDGQVDASDSADNKRTKL